MIDLCSDIRAVLQGNSSDEEKRTKILGWLHDFYTDYDLATDISVTAMLEWGYLENADTLYVPNSLRGLIGFIGGLSGKSLPKSLLADSTKAINTFKFLLTYH